MRKAATASGGRAKVETAAQAEQRAIAQLIADAAAPEKVLAWLRGKCPSARRDPMEPMRCFLFAYFAEVGRAHGFTVHLYAKEAVTVSGRCEPDLQHRVEVPFLLYAAERLWIDAALENVDCEVCIDRLYLSYARAARILEWLIRETGGTLPRSHAAVSRLQAAMAAADGRAAEDEW